MDSELIRKAAEAMLVDYRRRYGYPQVRFDDALPEVQKYWLENAEAALKVFYEQTRSQPREQAQLLCPDCGKGMIPAPVCLSDGHWTCPDCGKFV